MFAVCDVDGENDRVALTFATHRFALSNMICLPRDSNPCSTLNPLIAALAQDVLQQASQRGDIIPLSMPSEYMLCGKAQAEWDCFYGPEITPVLAACDASKQKTPPHH